MGDPYSNFSGKKEPLKLNTRFESVNLKGHESEGETKNDNYYDYQNAWDRSEAILGRPETFINYTLVREADPACKGGFL